MAKGGEKEPKGPIEEQLALKLSSVIAEIVHEATKTQTKTKKRGAEAEPEQLEITDEYLISVYEYIEERNKYKSGSRRLKQRDTEMLESIMNHSEQDRHIAAEAFVALTNEITKGDEKSNLYPVHPIVVKQLQELLPQEDYNEIGAQLTDQIKERSTSLKKFRENAVDESFIRTASNELLLAMVSRYIQAGFVKITESGNLSMTRQGKRQEDTLSTTSIEKAEWVRDLLITPTKPGQSVIEMYRANDEESRVQQVQINSNFKGGKVLFMSELLLGHKDADVEHFTKLAEHIVSLPEEEQPTVIVVSGLVQGDFKFLQKSRRSTLVPGLSDVKEQIKAARETLDPILGKGIQVIYNMSNDDRRISREFAIDIIRQLETQIESQEDMHYYKVDQMMQHASWVEIYNFLIEYGYPYWLRSGRTFDSADEFLAMKDYVRKMSNGEEIDPDDLEMLDIDNIHIPGVKELDDFVITDDVDLLIKSASREFTKLWIRHNFTFSDEPMYQSSIIPALETVRQLAGDGKETPHAFVSQHQLESLGVVEDGQEHDTWVIQTPGFIDSSKFVHSKASKTSAQGDVSRRLATTRRRYAAPGATMHELTDDGRHIVTFYNKKLWDKADSLEDRIVVASFADLQTGSTTGRHDAQVKAMDYVIQKILPNYPTIINFGGDQIQGRNYPNFPNENEHIGLISMDSQMDFVEKMIRATFSSLDPADIDNIIRFNVIPGNHEWNSGTLKWHGHSFTNYLKHVFEKIYLENGEKNPRVRQVQANKTKFGDQFKNWTIFEEIGGYGFLGQHLPLERGAKGGSGGLPIFQAAVAKSGLHPIYNDVDVAQYHHWHHAMYGEFFNKAMNISSALATQSPYELMRGYFPHLGITLIHMGGKKPLQFEFLNRDTLFAHNVRRGYFSKKQLRANGFIDDEGFDPYTDGMFTRGTPQSAIQKALWEMINEVKFNDDNVVLLGKERIARRGRKTA